MQNYGLRKKYRYFNQREIELAEEKRNTTNGNRTGAFSFKEIINGDIFTRQQLMKNLVFIIYIVFLTIVYIYNKYQTEKVLSDIILLKKDLKELRTYSVSNATELMSLSKESEVIRLVEENGLKIKPLKRPPAKIVVKDY